MEAGEGLPVGRKVDFFDSESEQMPDYFEWVLGWKHLSIDDDGIAHSRVGYAIWGERRKSRYS